jgi:DNA-binding MarR family transcriptional regulator
VSDSETLILWLCSQTPDDRLQGTGKVQGDLAVALGISPAQMSGLIERLHQRGLVASERSNLDRRRQIWRLTGEGEALLSQIETAAGELAHQIDAELSSAEQQQTDVALQRLIDAASHRPRLRPFTPENDHRDENPCEGGAQ